MSLTPSQRRKLMAMYLRVDPVSFDPNTVRLYTSSDLPVNRDTLQDIGLEVESVDAFAMSVAREWLDKLRDDDAPRLTTLRSRIADSSHPEIRYGEVLVLDTPPNRMPLPSPYHRASERNPFHPNLDAWLQKPPDVRVAFRDRVIAGAFLRPFEGGTFSGSPVYVVEEHRGRGLGKYLVSAVAERIRAQNLIPVALIADRNTVSRKTFRAVGYERELAVGTLSIRR